MHTMKKTFGKITKFIFFYFFLFDLLIGNYVYKKILRKNYIDGDIHFNKTGNDVLSKTFLSLYKE